MPLYEICFYFFFVKSNWWVERVSFNPFPIKEHLTLFVLERLQSGVYNESNVYTHKYSVFLASSEIFRTFYFPSFVEMFRRSILWLFDLLLPSVLFKPFVLGSRQLYSCFQLLTWCDPVHANFLWNVSYTLYSVQTVMFSSTTRVFFVESIFWEIGGLPQERSGLNVDFKIRRKMMVFHVPHTILEHLWNKLMSHFT